MKLSIAILLFKKVEVLDFAGPFEVFSVASEIHDNTLFNVFTIAEEKKPILTVNDLEVIPKYSFSDSPKIDILIIPGGDGTKKLLKNKAVLKWVYTIHKYTVITMSICSGALILGALNILQNKPFCTHHQVYPYMSTLDPTAIAQKNKRFTGFEKVYTSGGISAGIDLSFHILEKLKGKDVALKTATYMEYDRKEYR